MNSEATTQLIQTLTYILIPIIIAIFALIGFLVYLHSKENNAKREKENAARQIDFAESDSNSRASRVY